MTPDPQRIEQLARRRAKAKLGWFIHAAVYAAVNLGLIAVSVASGKHWAIFPLLGWGLGLAIHGIAVARGIAIGRAVLLMAGRADVAHYFIEPSRIESEIDGRCSPVSASTSQAAKLPASRRKSVLDSDTSPHQKPVRCKRTSRTARASMRRVAVPLRRLWL